MNAKARLIRSGVVAGLLAIALAIPGEASAAPLVRDRYSVTDRWVSDDCGFAIETTVAFEGLFMLKSGHGDDPTPYYFDNYQGTVTLRNVATGKWVQVLHNGLYKDLRITNLGGTLYEFEAIEVGRPFTIVDSDGNVLVRDRGLIETRFVVDTLGDDDIANDIFQDGSWELVKDAGAHPGLTLDYCSSSTELIG